MRNNNFTYLQYAQIVLLLIFGNIWLLFNVEEYILNTLILFTFITILGFLLCRKTFNTLDDNKTKLLATLWLFKLAILLFLLYAGWIPGLDELKSDNWGYDPQRYYRDAWDLVENNWIPTVALNYYGVLYYYGIIFKFFGHNPVIPALINAFVTLIGVLFLIRFLYYIRIKETNKDWVIIFLLLLPEFLWFDVMTSRETLLSVLIIVSIFSFTKYILDRKNVSKFYTISLVGGCVLFTLSLRTTIAIPIVGSIILITFYNNNNIKYKNVLKFFVFIFGLCFILIGPFIQKFSGDNNATLDLIGTFSSLTSVENNVATLLEDNWSNNSIGKLLTPNNPFQAILFLLPRTLLYIVSPLPNVLFSFKGLIKGDYSDWQDLFTIISSIFNIISVPFILASSVLSYKLRKSYLGPLSINISLIITFLSISGGNIIIQERYRIMATLLFYASAWLGYTMCDFATIKKYSLFWFSFLTLSGVFYILYKIS